MAKNVSCHHSGLFSQRHVVCHQSESILGCHLLFRSERSREWPAGSEQECSTKDKTYASDRDAHGSRLEPLVPFLPRSALQQSVTSLSGAVTLTEINKQLLGGKMWRLFPTVDTESAHNRLCWCSLMTRNKSVTLMTQSCLLLCIRTSWGVAEGLYLQVHVSGKVRRVRKIEGSEKIKLNQDILFKLKKRARSCNATYFRVSQTFPNNFSPNKFLRVEKLLMKMD